MGTPGEDTISGAGLTVKELLGEVRVDVKAIALAVNILVGQNLDSRLRAMETWREAASIEGARMVADVNATPVGKALEAGRVENSQRITKLERTIWVANGIGVAIITVVQVLPAVLRLLGISLVK